MLTNLFDRMLKWAQPNDEPTESLGSTEAISTTAAIVHSDELTAELVRARRYEHDLAIVVLSAHPRLRSPSHEDGSTSPESKLPQMIALLTAVALREALRGSDVVCYQAAQNRFVLALPETNAENAGAAVDRVHAHFRSRLRLRVRAGIACFPKDAFTLEELVASASLRTYLREPQVRVNGNGRDSLPRRRVAARVRASQAGGE